MPLQLITNSSKDGSLLESLKRLLNDEDLGFVDIPMSYIWTSGIRHLTEVIGILKKRKVTVRIVSTWRHGIGDFDAIYDLYRHKCDIRMFGDGDERSFHCKAWMFRHKGQTRCHAAIVGSSNLGASAVGEGVEWNVCAERSGRADADVTRFIDQCAGEFETLWQDPNLTPFDEPNLEFIQAMFWREKHSHDMSLNKLLCTSEYAKEAAELQAQLIQVRTRIKRMVSRQAETERKTAGRKHAAGRQRLGTSSVLESAETFGDDETQSISALHNAPGRRPPGEQDPTHFGARLHRPSMKMILEDYEQCLET